MTARRAHRNEVVRRGRGRGNQQRQSNPHLVGIAGFLIRPAKQGRDDEPDIKWLGWDDASRQQRHPQTTTARQQRRHESQQARHRTKHRTHCERRRDCGGADDGTAADEADSASAADSAAAIALTPEERPPPRCAERETEQIRDNMSENRVVDKRVHHPTNKRACWGTGVQRAQTTRRGRGGEWAACTTRASHAARERKRAETRSSEAERGRSIDRRAQQPD